MIDQNRKPGIGIGRGRGSLKSINENKIPNFENKTIESKTSLDTVFFQTSRKIDKTEIQPPKVTFVPNDDIDDYKLHVYSGNNFEKFENVKVKVTGKNIPHCINDLVDMGIPQFLIENVSNLGFRKLTLVQKYTMPIIAANRDVMACAETGSGKTAAFLIPIINAVLKLKDSNMTLRNSPHCLIMLPSRELCRQVYTVAVELSRSSSIRCAYGYGGVEMVTSLQKLKSCDILFVTPGRIVQYINRDMLLLDRLSYFVLDEADKLLKVELFQEALQLVIKCARMINNRDLHISMFSATFPREIQCLAQKILLSDYLFVAVGIVGSANSDINQTLLPVTAANKLDVTLEYIANHKLGKTLIFVLKKRVADFYGIRLIEMGLTVTTIHGDRCQDDRERALNDFKSGRVEVLVATDVASRGLDIPNVDTVLNVDMPPSVDIYIHRIGRSGRCGNAGAAVSFFDVEIDYHLVPRLIRVLRDSKQSCPEFLAQLDRGTKVDQEAIKSSTKDLRPHIGRADHSPPMALRHFMNMPENDFDEDEDNFE